MSLTKSLSTSTLNKFLIPSHAGGISAAYASANSFTVTTTVGLQIGSKFKATGGADRYGYISDISGLTITAENVVDSNGVSQNLHVSMSLIYTGYNCDVDTPINSIQFISSKATAKKLKVRAGFALFIGGDDGGLFYGITGATPGTYADDGGSYCGTKFIPNLGDGSSTWLRNLSECDIEIKFFGGKGDRTTNDTVSIINAVAAVGVGKTLIFSTGEYLITSTEASPIDVSNSGITIKGNNATIVNGSDRSFGIFKVSGSNISIEKLNFDGQDTSLNTLIIGDTAENVTIYKCEVKQSKQQTGDATFAVGIMVQNGSNNISIEKCYIHHIDAPITGIARGILASGYETLETHFLGLSVEKTRIEDISPYLDGDGIVFQPDDLTVNVNSSVTDCNFVRCHKRGIKVQGSGIDISGGTITLRDYGATDAMYSGISVYGDYCTVDRVKIIGPYASLAGLEVGAAGSASGSYTTLTSNTVKMTATSTTNDGIRVFGNPTKLDLFVNTVENVRTGIHISSNGSQLVAAGNIIKSCNANGIINAGVGGSYFSYMAVLGNSFNSITGFTIRNEGGVGFISLGNSSDETGTGSHGNVPVRMIAYDNIIANQPIDVTGTIAPTVGTWRVGDFVRNSNPNTYGCMGWLCVSSGTPGSWRALQVGSERSTTANRPTNVTMGVVTGNEWIGTMHFDTTLAAAGKPIWWTGIVWVDATGSVV
jgi:hypothetical protein